jgi:23S rRNA (uracil1939-C5)-methyltransferase
LVPEIELTIDRLAKTGEGVGTHQGQSLFIEGVIPGERARVRLVPGTKPKRAALVRIIAPSPSRRTAACPLSEVCGGCGWLHLDEAAQRDAKLEIVLSTLEHLAGIRRDELQVLPVTASARQLGYRRRAVMHMRGGRLCFFARRSRRAVAIDRCPAMADLLTDLPGRLTPFLAALASEIDGVHLLAEAGRSAFALFLRVAKTRAAHRIACEQAIADLGLSGAVVVPTEGSPTTIGEPVLRMAASPDLEVPLFLRPDAFAQSNAEANLFLVRAAVASLGSQSGERVLELYCGNGNFTFRIANAGATVTAVEQSAVALELARRSAREGKVANVRFVQGDAGSVCDGMISERISFDRMLVDPPRTGAGRLGHWADRLGVRQLTYVACDPAALARDGGRLRAVGFRARTLQLLDLFPQTPHIEAVMTFAR